MLQLVPYINRVSHSLHGITDQVDHKTSLIITWRMMHFFMGENAFQTAFQLSTELVICLINGIFVNLHTNQLADFIHAIHHL